MLKLNFTKFLTRPKYVPHLPPIIHEGRLRVLRTLAHVDDKDVIDTVNQIVLDITDAFIASQGKVDEDKILLVSRSISELAIAGWEYKVTYEGKYLGSYSVEVLPQEAPRYLIKAYVLEEIFEYYINDANLKLDSKSIETNQMKLGDLG